MIFIYLILFLFVNYFYIKFWSNFSTKVPTGIGILLIIPCYFFYMEQNLYYINIIILLTFSLIYFFDDLLEINFFYRILLQISASVVIYFSFITEVNLIIFFLNLLIFIVLVNTLNFQDGEDLNIATLLIIILSIFYFCSESLFIQNTAMIILIFLISFSIFNIKKNCLYFGDSGCYFLSIIFFLFIYDEMQNSLLIKSLISAILLPIIDVFYVVIYRVFKKQDILSRNYLHLYQILANKSSSKIYLLPNILFSALNIFISMHFNLGLNLIIFLFIINIFLLLMTRLTIKKLLN